MDPAEESVASSDTPGESAHEEDEDEDEAEDEVDALDSSENNKRKRSPTGSTHKPKRPPVSNRDADDTWSKVVQVLFAGNHSM